MTGTSVLKCLSRVGAISLSCVILLPVFGANASAQSVESFYKGRRINFVLSASMSGGYALYARTIIPSLEQHIPGNPSIILQNRPGGGGIVAANWLANVAPKDGSVLSMIHRGAVSNQPLFGAKNVQYDVTKFGWIGSMNSDISVCVAWHTGPVKTFADLKTKPSIFGGVGAGSDIDSYAKVLNNLFDTKIQLVTGYKTANNIHLAMERGEVHGRCGWSMSSLIGTAGEWIKEKKISLLVQIGLSKHEAIPEVPLLTDLTDDPDVKKVIETIAVPLYMGRPVLTTPGVSADRLAALRTAFDRAMADPDFKARAKKARLEYVHISGKDVEAAVKRIYALPKPVIEMATSALNRGDKTPTTKAKLKELTVKASIAKVRKKGREIRFKVGNSTHRASVSSRRTKITIGGASAKRSAIKPKMTCSITYLGDRTEASRIACD